MIKPQNRDNQIELRKVQGIHGNSKFTLVLYLFIGVEKK